MTCVACNRPLFSDKELILQLYLGIREARQDPSELSLTLLESLAKAAFENANGLCALGECKRQRMQQ